MVGAVSTNKLNDTGTMERPNAVPRGGNSNRETKSGHKIHRSLQDLVNQRSIRECKCVYPPVELSDSVTVRPGGHLAHLQSRSPMPLSPGSPHCSGRMCYDTEQGLLAVDTACLINGQSNPLGDGSLGGQQSLLLHLGIMKREREKEGGG